MASGMGWRLGGVIGMILFALFFLVPTVVQPLPSWWKQPLPTEGIHLGLDLQGGIHLVLEVDADKAVENSVHLLGEQIKRELRDKEIATRSWRTEGLDRLSFELVSRSRADDSKKYFAEFYPNLVYVSDDGRRFTYSLHELEAKNIRELAIDQALETIRNRVDEFGVSEPTIQRTGTNGVLVQLPGVQDPERAKRLIGRTAQLQFRIVVDDPAAPGGEVLRGQETDPISGIVSETSYTVEPGVVMTGEAVSDARHRPGNFGEPPYVAFTLNSSGASLFERITAENTGRRLAIVLDGRVQSAPVIRTRIGGGRGIIEGNFTLDEARDLAIVLRAGALPAPVSIAEERTVGPSLGRDSIRSGINSFLVGGVLVVIAMLVYYRLAGLVADIGLVLNVLILMGILSGFNATLTLPGIAGIVLTLGMAVDANVLINERIREELREGQTGHAAVNAGYTRALPAILDSNLTTFLAGVVLFQFGSGPIKGFALTLCVGIGSTIFSAVFAGRVMHDLVLARQASGRMSI